MKDMQEPLRFLMADDYWGLAHKTVILTCLVKNEAPACGVDPESLRIYAGCDEQDRPEARIYTKSPEDRQRIGLLMEIYRPLPQGFRIGVNVNKKAPRKRRAFQSAMEEVLDILRSPTRDIVFDPARKKLVVTLDTQFHKDLFVDVVTSGTLFELAESNRHAGGIADPVEKRDALDAARAAADATIAGMVKKYCEQRLSAV